MTHLLDREARAINACLSDASDLGIDVNGLQETPTS